MDRITLSKENSMVIITSKYVKPLDAIDSLLADHRKFLDDQFRQSKFICSGPQNPRVGGAIIANVGMDEAREIMKKDPFSIHGERDGEQISQEGSAIHHAAFGG
jgi:uncharacterized protein YciI